MMTREERAKQFAPFDAMKGLQEALRDREERYSRVERHDISEEQMEKNSKVLCEIEKGTKVHVYCYHLFHDMGITGYITQIDRTYRFIKIGPEKIMFSDIYDIEIEDYPV